MFIVAENEKFKPQRGGMFRLHVAPTHGCGQSRSAGCQPAVSPTASRQRIESSSPSAPTDTPQAGSLRYSRLAVCATTVSTALSRWDSPPPI